MEKSGECRSRRPVSRTYRAAHCCADSLCARTRVCARARARARVDPRAELPCLLFHSRRMTADPKKRGRVPLPSSFRETFIFALSVIETPRTRNMRARLSRSRVWVSVSRQVERFFLFFSFFSPSLFVFPLSSISVTALQGELVILKWNKSIRHFTAAAAFACRQCGTNASQNGCVLRVLRLAFIFLSRILCPSRFHADSECASSAEISRGTPNRHVNITEEA